MKKTFCVLLLLTMLLSLCACGGSAAATALDMDALASQLLESRAFSVSLEELPESKASVFYNVAEEDISAAVMYHASGVSKEQIALFTATDEDAARRIADTLRDLVAEWIESDRSYAPAEVPKLEKAVLRQSGVYVILVVAEDADTAADIVGKAL